MASKIRQGSDNRERLYTVRPRNSTSVTTKRGTPSSIRFNLPPELKGKSNAYETNLTSAEKIAFKEAINEDGLGFINFIAQSVGYSIQEKSQIMHTFGAKEAVYFYGRAPVMVQLSGTIVDDIDNNQFAQFLGLYNKFLRGSAASKEYSYVTLSVNNAVFIGSFMNISIQQSSDRDTDVTFSAQFLAKTFTIVSSDTVFAEGGADFTSDLRIRDPDPTLTRENIQAIIDNNKISIQKNATFDPDTGASLPQGANVGFFGDIPKSFGKLPTLEGLIGFSAADITDFFDIVSGTIDNISAPFTDLVSQIDDFARSAISLVESVEDGLDDALHKIDSITKQVYGAKDTIDDAITKITSFPKSLSSKLGHAGKPGGTPLKVVGSNSISSGDAASLLSLSASIGASRGTPQGLSASLSIAKSNNQTSLTPQVKSINEIEDTTPGLSISQPTEGDSTPFIIGG